MSRKLNAFVPAAGRGERLRPITDYIPKPLLPVRGCPLLSRALERVSALPVERIGVNLHHKAEALAAWLQASPCGDAVTVFLEKELLGTGGALKNAASLLRTGPFLVHNGDILTDLDLAALVAAHETSGHIATLALHDCPAHNKVHVDEAGRVLGVGDAIWRRGAARIRAYTGVAVYEPEFLDFLPEGESHAPDVWGVAIRAGRTVGSVDVTGCLWHDIGTPAFYAAAVVDALRRDGEWIHVGARVSGTPAELDGYVVLEDGCRVGAGARLRNVIALPSAHLAEGAAYENCIVGDGFCITLTEPEFLGLPATEFGVPIGVGGSGRRYFRFHDHATTAVRMVCPPDEVDYERHIEYSRFFARHGVPVPRLLRSDPEARRAEFEDLGDLSLYNYLRVPRAPEEVEAIYRAVLDSLIPLHVDAALHVEECELLAGRLFDFDYFRWETRYFLERFVEDLCGQRPAHRDALDRELDRLARDADARPKAVIHRDLQSQNIMIARGRPRFIDYQGARRAPCAYDIASLLWDPYYRLDDTLRERLLDHYIEQRTRRDEGGFSVPEFLGSLAICRLQRHMQALGAYAFLSTVQGKPYFRKHIPEGLRLLKQDVAETAERYPVLADLVATLRVP